MSKHKKYVDGVLTDCTPEEDAEIDATQAAAAEPQTLGEKIEDVLDNVRERRDDRRDDRRQDRRDDRKEERDANRRPKR